MPAIVTLKPGKDQSLRRLHPWVFSGAIARMQGQPQEGEVVIVQASNGEQLGMGHYAPGSIAVRMLGFGPEATEPDAAFWQGKLRNAYQLRQRLGLTTQKTNAEQPTRKKAPSRPTAMLPTFTA
ncbi:hypothetical protein [Hymenobacter qilianensis]|uniref:hypothetical protein n=1 Tax=Hymenobacter qilianensis TaxID=1385715 RepID=UPI00293B9E5C|nr:hypothetical protein [Hymenobacter qilianensis]